MGVSPDEPGFLIALRTAAIGYVRTAIAGASESEIDELCKLLVASDAALETYRPWNGSFGVDENNGHAADLLEPALAVMTMRRPGNAALCTAVGSYSCGFAQVAIEHSIPPVARIGLVAFLVASLRDEPPVPTLDDVTDAMRKAHKERETRKGGAS